MQYSVTLASFPGHSKAQEIWSNAVLSRRQMVDTRGVVSNCNNSHFMSTYPWHYEQQKVL